MTTEHARIAVLIVDDHSVVRQGLRTLLELQDDIVVVGEAASGGEAVQKTRQAKPDVVLMDLVMPQMDGITATREIRKLGLSARIIALTSYAEEDKIFAALKAGASGYLLKDVSPSDLVKAIRDTHAGEAHLHPKVTRVVLDEIAGQPGRPAAGGLTKRELEVLRLIAGGLSTRQIAARLTISAKTVKVHISNILSKLGLADRTQAAIYAIKHGLAQEDSPKP